METAVRTQELGIANAQVQEIREPKKLSKLGQWMLDNPGGLFYVKDRRAINRMRY